MVELYFHAVAFVLRVAVRTLANQTTTNKQQATIIGWSGDEQGCAVGVCGAGGAGRTGGVGGA